MSSATEDQTQRAIIAKRKDDHLALCASGEVNFRARSSLFEAVEFVHDSLPDFSIDSVSLEVELFGKRLKAPLIIAAMTGGTDNAERINCDLARAADELGLGFGLGSQRAMVVRPETASSFQVRQVAPRALILGNIGVVQAREMSSSAIGELVASVGADALCVHLNPAMELIQPNGDRDFGGGLETLRRLVHDLRVPVIAKETGCGISRSVAVRLVSAGVAAIDVSGAGGTSWVAVETRRATSTRLQRLGELLWDWGIPTAASVGMVAALGPEAKIIATGGVRSGVDVAKAIALGASAAGIAAPVLRAHQTGGYDGVVEFLEATIEELRAVTFLTGCENVRGLRHVPRVIGPELREWLAADQRVAAAASGQEETRTHRSAVNGWRDA